MLNRIVITFVLIRVNPQQNKDFNCGKNFREDRQKANESKICKERKAIQMVLLIFDCSPSWKMRPFVSSSLCKILCRLNFATIHLRKERGRISSLAPVSPWSRIVHEVLVHPPSQTTMHKNQLDFPYLLSHAFRNIPRQKARMWSVTEARCCQFTPSWSWMP